jgi:hypothetical protein
MGFFYRGKQVGEQRRVNDRLAMSLLTHSIPEQFGQQARQAGEDNGPEDRAQRLDRALAAIMAEGRRRSRRDVSRRS